MEIFGDNWPICAVFEEILHFGDYKWGEKLEKGKIQNSSCEYNTLYI